MECPDCGARTVAFSVPAEFREAIPGDELGVGLCSQCLALHPVADPPETDPDLQSISDAFPGHAEAAVPMALLVGLLSSLALYRSEVSDLLAAVERAGADPLLVLDRLAADESLEPAVDVRRRRHQLEQLLDDAN